MGSDPTARADSPGPGRYRFGGIVLDAAAHVLTRDGQPQALEPKVFAVLLELVRHAGELVSRDQLLDAVWGHRHVTPGVLTRAIAQLRTALDDDSHHPRYIQTQHALGYRFIGTLEPDEPPPSAPVPTDAPSEPTAAEATAEPTAAGDDPPAYAGTDRRRAPRGQPWQWLVFAGLLFAALAWSAWQRKADQPPRPVEASIAVLPFTTLTDDQQDRYFSEGLAAEMLSALAGVHGIRVAAWRPAEAIDRTMDLKALGRKLGVSTVLDASVRREGTRLRISAHLSDTVSGYTLWSRTYERDEGAVFETQSEIAREVAQSLVGVLPDEGESLRKRLTPTRNVAAFDAYLRGMQSLPGGGGGGNSEEADSHFRQALKLDKGFARAQAGLCRIEVWRFEAHRHVEAIDNAQLACLRAANMDPGLGEVQLALGDLYRGKEEWDKALEHFRNAERDLSVRQRALLGQADVLAERGQWDRAEPVFREALALDPDNSRVHTAFGYQQYLAGELPEAIASFRRACELEPGNAHIWSTYGGLLLKAGKNDEAHEALERSLRIEPIDVTLANLGEIRYQAGDYAAAVDLNRRALELNPAIAEVWGTLGDALAADPATAAQAREAYLEAAKRTQAFVDVNKGDAQARAQLGWYRANLGDTEAALDMVAQSEALDRLPEEVAFYNARTFALLGDADQARQRLETAMAAGIPGNRIATDVTLRRANLVPPGYGTDDRP